MRGSSGVRVPRPGAGVGRRVAWSPPPLSNAGPDELAGALQSCLARTVLAPERFWGELPLRRPTPPRHCRSFEGRHGALPCEVDGSRDATSGGRGAGSREATGGGGGGPAAAVGPRGDSTVRPVGGRRGPPSR